MRVERQTRNSNRPRRRVDFRTDDSTFVPAYSFDRYLPDKQCLSTISENSVATPRRQDIDNLLFADEEREENSLLEREEQEDNSLLERDRRATEEPQRHNDDTSIFANTFISEVTFADTKSTFTTFVQRKAAPVEDDWADDAKSTRTKNVDQLVINDFYNFGAALGACVGYRPTARTTTRKDCKEGYDEYDDETTVKPPPPRFIDFMNWRCVPNANERSLNAVLSDERDAELQYSTRDAAAAEEHAEPRPPVESITTVSSHNRSEGDSTPIGASSEFNKCRGLDIRYGFDGSVTTTSTYYRSEVAPPSRTSTYYKCEGDTDMILEESILLGSSSYDQNERPGSKTSKQALASRESNLAKTVSEKWGEEEIELYRASSAEPTGAAAKQMVPFACAGACFAKGRASPGSNAKTVSEKGGQAEEGADLHRTASEVPTVAAARRLTPTCAIASPTFTSPRLFTFLDELNCVDEEEVDFHATGYLDSEPDLIDEEKDIHEDSEGSEKIEERSHEASTVKFSHVARKVATNDCEEKAAATNDCEEKAAVQQSKTQKRGWCKRLLTRRRKNHMAEC